MNKGKSYKDRELIIQIKIDQLLRCYPYPLSFYEKMNDREIIGFHKNKLAEMAKKTVELYRNKPEHRQLKFL